MRILQHSLSVRFASLLLVALAFQPVAAHGQSSKSIKADFVRLERFDTVTLMFIASYGKRCPDLNVKAELYLLGKRGRPRFQTSCSANSANSVTTPGMATCFFREPIKPGTPGSQVLLRLWNAKADCSGYEDSQSIATSSFVEPKIRGAATESVYYRAQAENRLIEIDRENYRLRMDRNGGATYEFYNKRARKDGVPFFTNAIHANMGATLQVAFHNHGAESKMIPDSCDSNQGYWNPTQAGYFCSFTQRIGLVSHPDGPAPGTQSGLQISCDGQPDNRCTSAKESVDFSKFRMFNWDYGPSYPGPYNKRDQGYLSQNVTAHENYVQYDVTFQRKGPEMRGPIEIPTFYFTNNYRRYFFEVPTTGSVETVNIPERRTTEDNFRVPDNATDLRWISFENTSGVDHDAYTLAWYYEEEFAADVVQYGYGVSETGAYNGIKFTNQPIFNVKPNKTYHFRYVVFPYRYDEVIESEFGRQTVLETLRRMQVN